MENMSTTTVVKRSDSATSKSITDTLTLSPTNILTPAERKAFGKSDRKAGKVLGITLTRDHMGQSHHDRRLALCLSPAQENAQGGRFLGEMMSIGAKRLCSRNANAATIIGPLKDLGRVLASSMGVVEKRNKKRMAGEEYTQRVVLGLLQSNELPSKEGFPSAVSDDSGCTFLELDESEDIEMPLEAEFLGQNDEERKDDLFGDFSRDLVWERHLEAKRHTLDASPVTSLCYATASSEEGPALCSDGILSPAERAYLDFLIAQDEAEEQPIRGTLQSRNKMMNVLGAEARQVVC